MEKRIILATVISVLIIVGWNVGWKIISPPKQITVAPSKPEQKVESVESKFTSKEQSEKIDHYSGKDYTIESDKWKIVLNSLGAKIKHYYIKENIRQNDQGVFTDLIFNPEGKNFATFPEKNFELVSQKKQRDITLVSFSAEIDKSIKCYKTYEFSNNDYFHKLRISFESRKTQRERYDLELTFGPGLGSDERIRKEENKLTRVTLLENVNNKSVLKKLKPEEYTLSNSKWVSMSNRYFVLNIMDVDEFDNVSILKEPPQKLYQIVLSKNIVFQDKTVSIELPFYFGTKKYDKLKKYGYELEKTIDFGIFSPLSKLFLSCLGFFYRKVHNYGIAIIFLTIFIQIFTTPLTIKSFKATKSMKLLQPKIKELQQKYKPDPKRLNAEMMHLYKAQKVNPLGGCLPMLIQLPIFWALFTTLRNTYELRNAHFILWITDLSSPDLLFSIGNIPVRVLPLLMGVSMFIQQKISGGGAVEQSQKMLTYLMPVIFTIIFMNFPSGLVLYWLVNNILMITIQFFLLRRK